MADKPTFINVLRIWLGLIGTVGIINIYPCFLSRSFIYPRIYTVDHRNVTGLTERLYGVWTLLSCVIRLMCAFNITNKTVYHLTLFSFILALGHFSSEMWIYETTVITAPGIIAPFVVTFVSIILMVAGFFFIRGEDPRALMTDENQEILSGRARKKLR